MSLDKTGMSLDKSLVQLRCLRSACSAIIVTNSLLACYRNYFHLLLVTIIGSLELNPFFNLRLTKGYNSKDSDESYSFVLIERIFKRNS